MVREGVEAGVSTCAMREPPVSLTNLTMMVGSSLQELRTWKSVLSEHDQGINQGYRRFKVKHNLARHRL